MKKPRMSLKRGKHRIWIGSAGKKKSKVLGNEERSERRQRLSRRFNFASC